MPRGGQACKCVGEFFTIERLDQKAVHAGFKARVAILDQRVRSEGEDRRLAARLSRLKATDTLGGFDAVKCGIWMSIRQIIRGGRRISRTARIRAASPLVVIMA